MILLVMLGVWSLQIILIGMVAALIGTARVLTVAARIDTAVGVTLRAVWTMMR